MPKDWTVIVYMGADDPDDAELVASAFQDLEEMRKAGSSPRINIAVQMDLPLFSPVRFLINEDGTMATDRGRKLGRLRESSTGRGRTLSAFLEWARNVVPAGHYLLVLWGHGLGVGFEVKETSSNADVTYDADDGLTIPELASALRRFKVINGRPIDILGFDSCYMSAVEVGYQNRNLVDFVVGTQVTMPFEGWPYEPILKSLRAHPERTPASLARAIARKVVKSYRVETVTQTVLRPAAADGVSAALRELACALDDATHDPREIRAIQRAFTRTKYLKARQFLDLRDLCRRIASSSTDSRVKGLARSAAATLEPRPKAFVVEHHTRGPQSRGLNGVSIYVRWVRAKRGDERVVLARPDYMRLSFVRTTRWQQFNDRFIRRLRALHARPSMTRE